MASLIETAEQELQWMIGRLIWENTAMRYQIERLNHSKTEQTKETASSADAEADK